MTQKTRHVPTVCARDCYDTCSLIASLDDTGRVVAIKGDPDHPITQGFVCPRGQKDHERLYRNRVEVPHLRRGEQLRQASWDESLDTVAHALTRTLETHGPEAVLYLDYSGNMGLLTTTFPRRLWHAIGATQTDGALCTSSGHQGLRLHYGASHGTAFDELGSMDLIVFWGFNAAVSSPHAWALAKNTRRQRGTRIAVIDPRRSRTAREANLWIRPKPGSDVALAYGVIRHLIENDLHDRPFIDRWTQGFAQLDAEARRWTPERVMQVTGVTAQQIEQLGDAYGSLKPSVTMLGIGLQKQDRGADQVRAVSLIPALVGLHRGFFYTHGRSQIDEELISGLSLTERPHQIVSQVGLADLVHDGAFRFIYVTCTNPAATLPHQHLLRAGLSRDDVFVVVHDTHWTRTAAYADVELPAPSHLEKDDLIMPWGHGYIRCSNRIVPPVTDSRSEICVMQELGRRLGLTEPWLYQDPWEAVETAFADALADGDFTSLRAGNLHALKRPPRRKYPTPSGKIELWASAAESSGQPGLPVQALLPAEAGRFVLLNSATRQYTSTQFQEVYGPIPAIVTMNEQDGDHLGIEEGDRVNLTNERGQMAATVSLSDAVPEGVLWAPRQSEESIGEPLNGLTSSTPQEIGGGPRFNSTTVTITRS